MKAHEIKAIGEELAEQLETAEKVVVQYSRWKRWATADVVQAIADVGGICFHGREGGDLTFFHYP